MFYAELNSSLDAILGQYAPGRMFRNPDGIPIRFGANAVDKNFTDEGLFKVVESLPVLTSDQEYGDQTVSGDTNTMIATVSRAVVTKSTQTKVNEIEQTFQASLQSARGSHTPGELEIYKRLSEEARVVGRNPTATAARLDNFASGRGLNRAQAILEIGSIIDPVEAEEAEALGIRDKAIADL